jgi:hypothetical protein
VVPRPRRWNKAYLANRERLLRNVVRDHVRWEHLLTDTPDQRGFLVHWVDSSGQAQATMISLAYLNAHRQIIHALVADLDACGAPGRTIVETVIAEQMRLFEEGDVL